MVRDKLSWNNTIFLLNKLKDRLSSFHGGSFTIVLFNLKLYKY